MCYFSICTQPIHSTKLIYFFIYFPDIIDKEIGQWNFFLRKIQLLMVYGNYMKLSKITCKEEMQNNKIRN